MSKIDSTSLATLRNSLSHSATVNLPGDREYSVKRWARNAEKPAALVGCPATNEDVVQLVTFVQGKAPYESQQKLHLAVKGGGHTPSGASSSDGGLVIDLQPHMNNVRVDPEAKLAYVQGGALWGDVDKATFPYGLASVSGVVSHTGVGGLTLGGGFGWLCGQHGLVADNLIQATIVTSTGDILTANDSENKELYWALRGGGGNFGVVTEFVLKLHEQRADLYSSALIFPPPLIERLVLELNAWLKERSPLENAHIIFALGPNGQPGVIMQLIYNGDSDEGAAKFERFVKLGPVVNRSETLPYMRLNTLQDANTDHGDFRILQGNYIPVAPEGLPIQLVTHAFNAWLKFVTENPAASTSISLIELYHHVKWSSVPSDATAYVQRNPTYNMEYLLHWKDPSFTERAYQALRALDQEFVKSRDESIGRGVTGQGGYTNYLDEESRTAGVAWLQRRFGSNYARLIEVKQKFDPTALFGRWFVETKDF
ncbi:unnamed protein product [Rhizoctonia solani]|uniref:FAD-binding PCMH-type domain-containing protein n=1 Tax=Rhizoctonia solani TaxID=456999 RepID=A0A8H3BJL6_9AGAM|nr:unnamed protein product [Rhizoctonia solani]